MRTPTCTQTPSVTHGSSCIGGLRPLVNRSCARSHQLAQVKPCAEPGQPLRAMAVFAINNEDSNVDFGNPAETDNP
eukprot:11175630-Lingulodinium_polyedra.AAC.1